jgi:MFS family permease
VDRFGVRLGLVVLTIGSAFGQSLHTLAIWANNYHCILLARMIQGISYESLIVAQAAMACKWFRGKEASFAMGLIITLPELGDALNSILTPPLY